MSYKYGNMDIEWVNKSFADLRKWRKERKAKKKDLSYVVPSAKTKQIGWLRQNRSETSITWIGHSTFLLQIGGLNVLTDPVWAESMGFQKRLSAPGLTLAELPPIDVVLLSHSHYDHMHMKTLSSLRRQPSGEPMLLVPAGLSESLRKKGFRRVEELQWWGTTRAGGVEFHFVPAQHWTRRTLWDTNNSHWGGWVLEKSGDDGASGVGAESGNNLKEAELRSGSSLSVEGTGRVDDGGWKSAEPDYAKRNGQTAEEAGEAGGRSQGAKPAGLTQASESRKGEDSAGKQTIYFAGDSGYFRGFGLIGERFKPDYTLMPIGAYEPEWFMALQHVTPEEAVQAFLDANGEVMIPMHYGAFRLADDTPKEALDRLYAEWQRRGLPAERLLVPALGETLRF